jgi:hypothetical protein
VIALLHYAFLKGMRDRSLPIFVLITPAQVAAMLIGAAVLNRHLRYPLMMDFVSTQDLVTFSIVLPWTVASLSAFWTFRSEVATKAIGSFVIASRPMTIVAALVVFAAATAIGGVLGAIGTIAVLTAALPANLGSLASIAIIFSLVGASLGALYVTISPQPAMLVWAIIAGFPLAPWIFGEGSKRPFLMIAAVVSIITIGVSTILLRRRCAT